ncbi:radical SAM protein [Desulfobaculum bizertense]|uniref:radical SAM (seleno)protein TrsS n=1 Tax=Desulfobaculum bizertense TaxID=376490 RepID=UPI001F29D519|nr:radical SAM (seleno)protein TrsS [Desulfobaculum bizertense]UIJ38196.1 radical SAM protein [Desulfobaculum bizertense]
MASKLEFEHTQSVCPVCLRRIPATRQLVGNETRLVKTCPEHGTFSTPVWRGIPEFHSWRRPKSPSAPPVMDHDVSKGCPFDCGLCPEHRQHTCTTLVEITWRCDLGCPVCFASAGGKVPADPSLAELDALLGKVRRTAGDCNLQLSGGEPAVRNDLPQIAECAKAHGFPFVQVNSNGLRMANEPGFAQRLASAGVDSVFLQFDGTEDAIYSRIRGRALYETKLRAIENLCAAGIGVVLVPTVVPGVNDHNLDEMLKLAIAHAPGVRGIHFQPVSYFGRYPKAPSDVERITLPEVMAGLEAQSNGLVSTADFLPPACEHELCSFHANYLVLEDGTLHRLSSKSNCCCTPHPAAEGAEQSRAFVRRQWAAAPELKNQPEPEDDLDRFIQRAKTHILAVSGMAFQDAWTLDLERLKGCCIHVAAPDGRLIPFCAYNLTAADGRTLYRGKCHAQASA